MGCSRVQLPYVVEVGRWHGRRGFAWRQLSGGWRRQSAVMRGLKVASTTRIGGNRVREENDLIRIDWFDNIKFGLES